MVRLMGASAQRLGTAAPLDCRRNHFAEPTKSFLGATKASGNRFSLSRRRDLQKGYIMISFSQRTFRRAGLTVALAIGLCASSNSSFAFSPEAQQMCTGDAFRLCSSAIPNVSAVTACMLKQRASLSAGCRTVMDRDLAQQSRKVATQ
jgi:hypothetical protein